MKYSISNKLVNVYKNSHKNYDYALLSILGYFDSQCLDDALEIVRCINLDGDKTEIEIGDSALSEIRNYIPEKFVKAEVIELLLWVAVLFPET